MLGRFFKKTDYKNLLENGALIVDVRSPQEYAGGAIPGSENIPIASLSLKFSSRWEQINENRFFTPHPDAPNIAVVLKKADHT